MPRRGENIYKRKDGRWEGRILKPDGKYQYVYAKTYSEVKEKKKNLQQGVHAMKKSQSVTAVSASILLKQWLVGNVMDRVKPSTYESYYRCIQNYVIPYFKSTGENRITEYSAAQFVKKVKETIALSSSSKRKIITIFKIAIKEILKDSDNGEKILEAIKVPRIGYPQVEVFSVIEQRKIEARILKMDDVRALGVLLCFYTGIRLGELCALKWENINFETKTMSIVKTVSRTKNFQSNITKTILNVGTPKSCHSVREIPLPNFLVKMISGMKNVRNTKNYILSGTEKPIDPRTYQKFFKKILNDADVKKRKFHAIRHTFATRALEAGIDIKTLSEILGHSSVLITLKVYAHSLMEQKIAAMEKLNDMYITHIDLEPFAVTDSVIQK